MTDDPLEKAERVARVKGAAADMRRKEALADKAETEARAARERAERQAAAAEGVKQEAAPAKGGRPSKYTKAAGDRICAALAGGASLRQAAAAEGVDAHTVLAWRDAFKGFSTQYAEARARGQELLAEAVVYDIPEEAARAALDKDCGAQRLTALRMRSDNIKWHLAKMLPKVYGERQAVELTGAGGKDLFPRMTDEERAEARAACAESFRRISEHIEDEGAEAGGVPQA